MKLHRWFPESRPWLSRVGVFFNLLYHYTDGKQLAMFYREQDQREGCTDTKDGGVSWLDLRWDVFSCCHESEVWAASSCSVEGWAKDPKRGVYPSSREGWAGVLRTGHGGCLQDVVVKAAKMETRPGSGQETAGVSERGGAGVSGRGITISKERRQETPKTPARSWIVGVSQIQMWLYYRDRAFEKLN